MDHKAQATATFAAWVESAGMTRDDIARGLGVNQTTIRNWARGRVPVPPSAFVAVGRLLGKPAAEVTRAVLVAAGDHHGAAHPLLGLTPDPEWFAQAVKEGGCAGPWTQEGVRWVRRWVVAPPIVDHQDPTIAAIVEQAGDLWSWSTPTDCDCASTASGALACADAALGYFTPRCL